MATSDVLRKIANRAGHDASGIAARARRWWVCGLMIGAAAAVGAPLPYLDPRRPLDERVADLVGRMTLEEKASLMVNSGPGVPRLGVPKYDWWNEGARGVAMAGIATVFPHSIGQAATWDDALVRRIGEVVATEGRALYAQTAAENSHARYHGLTFWSPCINLARDPRWGRTKETFGEDPFLTSRLGMAFVRGMQGDDPHYLRAAAAAKHFAVHSGPETLRHILNVAPSETDFHETYLPAFEALVRQAHVAGIMGAYTSLYGHPAIVSPRLYDLLYRQWGFRGYVTSDCNSIRDLWRSYKVAHDGREAEAMAAKAGSCLTCGAEAPTLAAAVRQGLLDERTLDDRVGRLMRVLFQLGIFDPPQDVPYANIPPTDIATPAHHAVALQAARESIVLLKNDGVLPLNASTLHRVAVIGPNAESVDVLIGKHAGQPAAPVTIADGLRAALGPEVVVDCVPGCAFTTPEPGEATAANDPVTAVPTGPAGFDAAVRAARAADVVIFAGGTTGMFESEQMKVSYAGFDHGDRTRIELPEPQEKLLEALQATGRPVVFVLMSGSAVAVPWADAHVNAILEAWFPGESGGTAVAAILLGKVNPSGRLPVTFYRATTDLPAFSDYAMANRTYRFFPGKVLYAFGHGLSYTHFAYRGFSVHRGPANGGPRVVAAVDVTNTGERAGDEVVQLYAREPRWRSNRPRLDLVGYRRVHLEPHATAHVTLDMDDFSLRRWDPKRRRYLLPGGIWTFSVGAASDDLRASAPCRLPTAEVGSLAK